MLAGSGCAPFWRNVAVAMCVVRVKPVRPKLPKA
jgi:hypothetical protein